MNLEALCDNFTPCSAEPFITTDAEGADVLAVVAKLTWLLPPAETARYAIPQRPIRRLDEMTNQARMSSVRYPSDQVDFKPGTDVILVGSVHPPPGGGSLHHDVSLRVETGKRTLAKSVRVHGPRRYEAGLVGIKPGKSEPLEVTPIVYELAPGGFDYDGTKTAIDDKNPCGRGVSLDESSLIGMAAPQLETLGGQAPAGFGALGPLFEPRRSRAGTLDETWARSRAPLRPADFDARHHCVAHPDLWSEEPLSGSEPVEVLGATPEQEWRFQLPGYAPSFECTVAGKRQHLETHLDTFLVDADHRVVELCWRASVRLPRKLERLEGVVVRDAQPLPEEIHRRALADLQAYQNRNP